MAARKKLEKSKPERKIYGKVYAHHFTFNSLILEIEIDPWTRTAAVLDLEAVNRMLPSEFTPEWVADQRRFDYETLWAEFEPGDDDASILLVKFIDSTISMPTLSSTMRS